MPAAPSRPKRPSTPARSAASRANARKSTGPRTPAGKRRSSRNALKHGLTADGILSNPILPNDPPPPPETPPAPEKPLDVTTLPPILKDDPDYEIRRLEYIRELRPTSPTQQSLVDQLALISWRLDQLPDIERRLLATPLGQSAPAVFGPEASRPFTHPERMAYRDPTPAHVLEHLLHPSPTPLTRLWDLQYRLLARFQSILRILPRLKAQRDAAELTDQEEARRRAEREEYARECAADYRRLHGLPDPPPPAPDPDDFDDADDPEDPSATNTSDLGASPAPAETADPATPATADDTACPPSREQSPNPTPTRAPAQKPDLPNSPPHHTLRDPESPPQNEAETPPRPDPAPSHHHPPTPPIPLSPVLSASPRLHGE